MATPGEGQLLRHRKETALHRKEAPLARVRRARDFDQLVILTLAVGNLEQLECPVGQATGCPRGVATGDLPRGVRTLG